MISAIAISYEGSMWTTPNISVEDCHRWHSSLLKLCFDTSRDISPPNLLANEMTISNLEWFIFFIFAQIVSFCLCSNWFTNSLLFDVLEFDLISSLWFNMVDFHASVFHLYGCVKHDRIIKVWIVTYKIVDWTNRIILQESSADVAFVRDSKPYEANKFICFFLIILVNIHLPERSAAVAFVRDSKLYEANKFVCFFLIILVNGECICK